ncbi:response regulator transcription factor [Ideonella sp.]|uniref:response regulator transcription factor n=1 Tax=Ideonella sp. TaxID=1929293 RepID=UPI002B49071E|nr:response regulator transcription factor [Ideonella sp.]HJV68777.1 response regulator transcription factor [Ideonella sp.]
MALRLLVVDDHTIFRAGITRLMLDEPDICVTGEAADGAAALALMRSHQYDVVLMDINMGARSGLDTLAALRAEFPRLPVIMLSMYVEPQYARRAHKARANAYLSKDVGTDELMRAIRHVAAGGIWVTPAFGAAPDSTAPGAPHGALTPREMQVMLQIAQGISLTEIGTRLCLSVKTVGSHRSRVLDKLGLASDAEVVQYAMRHRLID